MVGSIVANFLKRGQGDQSFDKTTLIDQEWQLGVKGLAPVLYLEIDEKSIVDTTHLVNALNAAEIKFDERTRSTGARIIEVMGEGFVKLGNIIGNDRVNQLHFELDAPHIQAVDWKFGLMGGMRPTLFVDLTETDIKESTSLVNALQSRGVEFSQRTNSKGHEVLEVKGDSLLKLNDIIDHPDMSRPLESRPEKPKM